MRRLRGDFAAGAGDIVLTNPQGAAFTVGEEVGVYDDDTEMYRALVLDVTTSSVTLRVDFTTVDPAPDQTAGSASVFDAEIGPLERQLGVAYLADVDLDHGQALHVGDQVQLRDEGGELHPSAVVAIEPGKYGNQVPPAVPTRRWHARACRHRRGVRHAGAGADLNR